MKVLNLRIAGFVTLMTIIACNSDKQAKLTELRKKHDSIAEQIKQLEKELSVSDTSSLDKQNGLKVAYQELKSQVFKHFIEVQGKLDGEENIGVSAKILGVVDAVYVKMGDKVTKDQILAQLDDAILQQNLQQMNTNLKFVTELYEKQKNLWEQKIGSEVQYLSAKNNKESLENSIKTLQDQIDMTRIKSPINGTVEDIGIRIGQSVAPGFALFRVVNFNSIKVVAEIAEAYSSRVKAGDDVIIYFPDLQKEMGSKISSASKYISPQNRTFQVESRLNPDYNGFKANMIAILKINDYKTENAIVVPINILQNDQEGNFVFLAEMGNPQTVARKVRVKMGVSYNGMVEITEGLKSGDIIITAGQLELQEGETVRL